MGSEAKAIIDKLIAETLLSESPREKLDKKFHILDLSYDHVVRSNKLNGSLVATRKAYEEFIFHVIFMGRQATSLEDAIEASISSKGSVGTQYIDNIDLLVCKNFDTARKFISKISKMIPDNIHFGISYRERTFEELKSAYKIEEDSSLKPLLGKSFLLANGTIGQVIEVETEFAKTGRKARYALVPQESLVTKIGIIKFIAVKDREDSETYKIEPIGSHIGAQITSENNEISLVHTDSGLLPILKRTYLSKLDLGHLFKKSTIGGETPLGARLQQAVSYPGLSAKNQKLVQTYINKLDKAHGKVDYIFHNNAASGSAEKIYQNVGFVALTVQFYKENNRLAVIEGRIKRELTKKFIKIAASLPGSNTIVEDTIEKATNMMVATLGGKVKPLKKHKPVSGTVDMFDKALPRLGYGNTSGPNKAKKSASIKSKPLKITQSSYSLLSLQNLINSQLQDVVSANMGDGNSRNILNYRTGRLASSAKVESMSESRNGMITAFYSYMKNPYATFSDGGKQQNPQSRDPKLLISKSIREIAQQQVSNQLRAVAV